MGTRAPWRRTNESPNHVNSDYSLCRVVNGCGAGSDTQRDTGGAVWLPVIVTASVPLLAALGLALWAVPYAISETVGVLESLEQHGGAFEAVWNLHAPFFRPAFWGSLQQIWDRSSSVPAAMTTYKLLHVATVLLVPLVFLAAVRPRTALEAVAAAFALATLVGSPAFRDNLENLPLNQMMIITLLSLVVWWLGCAPGRWRGPLAVLLTAVAIGFKEEGIVLGAVVAAGAWLGSPGFSRRTGLVTAGLCGGYIALRLSTSGQWPTFMQDIGLGFSVVTSADATARFGAFPYAIYAYNAAASAANVLFSEPTSGVFGITRAITDGTAEPWQVIHLATSAGTTALLAWWAAGVMRTSGSCHERRVLAATVAAIAVSALLGFKYTRDRFGGVAVAFYALAVFEALRMTTTRLSAARLRPWLAAVLVLGLLHAGWQIRVIGTVQYVRARAEHNQKEWLVDVMKRRERFAHRPTFLRMMEALQPQGTDTRTTAPGPDPAWFGKVLGQ